MIKIIGFIFMAISFIGVMWIAFKFPEMTERQLVIFFWKEYLLTILAVVLGLQLIGRNQ